MYTFRKLPMMIPYRNTRMENKIVGIGVSFLWGVMVLLELVLHHLLMYL